MFSVKYCIRRAKDQTRAALPTSGGQAARELDINCAGQFRVVLAQIDVRDRCGMDYCIWLQLIEKLPQL
jgi:hypothetical protein